MLTWEPLGDGLIATRNGHTVGIIAKRIDDGLFAWEVTACHTKWTGKGSGRARRAAACRAPAGLHGALRRGSSRRALLTPPPHPVHYMFHVRHVRRQLAG